MRLALTLNGELVGWVVNAGDHLVLQPGPVPPRWEQRQRAAHWRHFATQMLRREAGMVGPPPNEGRMRQLADDYSQLSLDDGPLPEGLPEPLDFTAETEWGADFHPDGFAREAARRAGT